MFRKIVAVWVCLVLLAGIVVIVDVVIDITPPVKATTITVDDSGGADYLTIQEGIDAANPGDTVFVYNGTYYENVVVNKTINLTGEDREKTLINANGNGDVVFVSSDWVNVTGFNVTGSGPLQTDSGIVVENSDNCAINNNIFTNNGNGMLIYGSNGNDIAGNNVFSNFCDSILIMLSDGNTISDNIISSTGTGTRLWDDSDGNIVNNNFITSCWGDGGVYIQEWSINNKIYDNTFIKNYLGLGILDDASNNNKIYHNNFIDNSIQASDNNAESNIWDNGYPSGGNYWDDFDEPSENAYDDYKGINQNVLGSDGIVDKGIGAGGGKNPYWFPDDNYPLINPQRNYLKKLYPGWNLISVPFVQSNTDINSVLSPIGSSYDVVQWFNISDTSDPWKHHQISKPSHLNDLIDINHTMGFWIHITNPGAIIFLYNGAEPTSNQSISLYPGWNMVGYPSLSNRNRTAVLNNINYSTEVDAIWTYNATTQTWKEITASDNFEVGRGYWMHSKVTKTWIIPL